MATQWPVEVSRDTRVTSSPERSIAIKMPAAISDRLDSLVKKVEVVRTVDGQRRVERGTNRKELIAALIYDAPANRRDLNRKLKRYRGARVASTVLGRPGQRVELPGNPPGPRPTSG
jgi:hypothetical protein